MLSVLSGQLDIPSYSTHWIEDNVVCSNPGVHCFLNECENCRNCQQLQLVTTPANVTDEEVEVVLWQKRKNDILGGTTFVKLKVRRSEYKVSNFKKKV